MKKLLHYLQTDQSGSMFVYLFYLSTMILFFTFTMITHLENEQSMSVLEIELLHLNMIHQQAYQSVLNNFSELELSAEHEYAFPNGHAQVRFNRISEAEINMIVTAIREPPYQKVKRYILKLEPGQ